MTWMRPPWTKVRRMSFRARLGTLIALAVGLTVAVAAVASYFVVHHQLYSQMDRSLQSDVQTAINPGGGINQRQAETLIARTGGFLQVISPTGLTYTTLNGSSGVGPNRAQEAVAGSGGSRYDTITSDGVDYRVLTIGGFADFGTGAPVRPIQIARPWARSMTHTVDLRL